MQSPIVLAYGNLVTPLVTMTASSSQPTLPPAYSAADFRGVVSYTAAGHATEEWIQGHWPTAQAFNCAALTDSNLTADGTIEIRGSTDGFAASDDQIVPPSSAATNPALFMFSQVTGYTDVRWVFRDPTNPAGLLRFGKLFLGNFVQPSVNYAWGWSEGLSDRSLEIETPNNVAHFNRKAHQRMPKASWVKVPEADRDLMDALVSAVGITDPFLVALDPDNHPEKTYLVRFVSALPEPVQPCFQRFSYQMALKEVL